MLSELDKAVVKANENPDEFADQFYELFLNSTIFIPTWNVPEDEDLGEKELEEDMAVNPIIIPEEDGTEWLLLFDSQERIQEWVNASENAQEIGIIGLSGYEVLKYFGFGNGLHMVLNAVSDYPKEFVPEEIEHILSNTTSEE